MKFMKRKSKLLMKKNLSLKIYLDGFEVLDFLRTAEIIRIHGGKISIPSEDTVTLSKPIHPPGTNFIRFDINWLHESIKNNKLLDIGKYIIPKIIIENNSEEIKNNNNSEKASECSENQKILKEPKEQNNSLSSNENEKENNNEIIEEFEESEIINSEIIENYQNEEIEKENCEDPNNILSIQNVAYVIEVDNDNNQEIIDNSSNIIINDETTINNENIDDSSKSNENQNNKLIPFHSNKHFKESSNDINTCWRYPNITIENSQNFHLNKSSKSDDENKKNNLFPKLSKKRLYPINSTPNLSGKREKIDVPLSIQMKYLDEDDQKIIKYLIDNDAISKTDQFSIWENMVSDEILPNRTAASLKYRFTSNLVHCFNNYTDDPVALEKFQKYVKKN